MLNINLLICLYVGSGYSNKKFECDYGLKILKMMGWKDGNGLGKSEDGIKECIQAKRRDENAGVTGLVSNSR